MDVHQFLLDHGGSARWATIRRRFPQSAIENGLRDGLIVRASRGMYSVPRVTPQQDAKRHRGVVSHYTAAQLHDMGAVVIPDKIDISVESKRSRIHAPPHVRVHYSDVQLEEEEHRITTPLRTAVDCARSCAFPVGLAIVETGVLQGKVDCDDFRAIAFKLRGPGARRARRIAQGVDLRPQKPFESYLRGLLIDEGLTEFEPQFQVIVDGEKIATTALGHPATNTLIEVTRFEESRRQELANDALRYDNLIACGFAVLQFDEEHLRHEPARVLDLVKTTLTRHSR